MAVRWLKETEHKASRVHDLKHLRWLDQHLSGLMLNQINRDCLDSITQGKLATGVSNGTVNRMLAVVRSILRKSAIEYGNGWIKPLKFDYCLNLKGVFVG